MPTQTQVILCWALFTGTMALLSVVLHAVVPPMHAAIVARIGVGPLGALMIAAWCVGAWFVYRPLLARGLANRRHRTIQVRQ